MTPVKFPLVDALLQIPEQGKEGTIGICTNSTAPGQVLNELEESHRGHVAALGSLVVNRDGAERMIINSLVHPTLTDLILFAEEGVTFSPSTNLLAAIQHGYVPEKNGNFIQGGRGASPHYPNISSDILDTFRNHITVLPAYTPGGKAGKTVVTEYLDWLKPCIDPAVYELLVKINKEKKIYYDSLRKLIETLAKTRSEVKRAVKLDAKDFQQLQPPKIELENEKIEFSGPFNVSREGKNIRLDIKVDEEVFTLVDEDDFLLGYSLMKHLGDRKKQLTPLTQLLLGAELGLMKTKIANDLEFDSLVKPVPLEEGTKVPSETRVSLKTDTKYYYRIGIDGKNLSVMCMAFDVCEKVFDLRSEEFGPLIKKLAEMDRFEDYEMDFLHRMDIGTQIARAYVAAKLGYSFMQDFSGLFKINKTDLPLIIADEDTFLATHRSLLSQLYTKGLTEEHGDSWKGLTRTGIVLAIYRDAEKALAEMVQIYKQGEQTTKEVRAAYRDQLLRFDHDGSYSYGERTRAFFGFDQLPKTAESLRANPKLATIVQRFDPAEDMGTKINEETGKKEFTHDPCLTHDIYFVRDGKLHGFHIARAHNTVNAYPENIFGLFDAYTTTIKEQLNLEIGDEFMLSSRANILLLTEEQRTRKLLSEPAKPSDDLDTTIGPHRIGENTKPAPENGAIAYIRIPLQQELERPQSVFLDRLENYRGINIVSKAITYLNEKGPMHNNPILSTYHAAEDDPQSEQLVFLQANVFGQKLHMTATFANHAISHKEDDLRLLNYIATKYAETLAVPLGDLTLFYVCY